MKRGRKTTAQTRTWITILNEMEIGKSRIVPRESVELIRAIAKKHHMDIATRTVDSLHSSIFRVDYWTR